MKAIVVLSLTWVSCCCLLLTADSWVLMRSCVHYRETALFHMQMSSTKKIPALVFFEQSIDMTWQKQSSAHPLLPCEVFNCIKPTFNLELKQSFKKLSFCVSHRLREQRFY